MRPEPQHLLVISHRFETVFVHVPKTAGQSIEQAFIDRHGLTWETRAPLLLRPNPDPGKGPYRLAHLLAGEYVGLGHIEEEQFRAYFKFGFVRNPWERLVSAYAYLGLDRSQTFADFVRNRVPLARDKDRFLLPQRRYLFAGDRCLVDFVGRFENLAKDFKVVCDRSGLGPTVLPHENRVPRDRPWPEFFDAELTARVADLYAEDIDTFGYAEDAPGR
ncbi:MAG: sulfotransferase family 2 domain-containing protein [Pseudomonadota bacterium]